MSNIKLPLDSLYVRLKQNQKELQQLQSDPKTIPMKCRSLYESMKVADEIGFQFENHQIFEDAYIAYDTSIEWMKLLARCDNQKSIHHHMAICHWAMARIALHLPNDSLVLDHYDRFLSETKLALRDKIYGRTEYDEDDYLCQHIEDLGRLLALARDDRIIPFIKKTESVVAQLFESLDIQRETLERMNLTVLYLKIMSHDETDITESMHEQYCSSIDILMHQKDERSVTAMYVYQFSDLAYSSKTSIKHRDRYLSWYEAYIGAYQSDSDHIYVFISSTFRDFFFERDVIQHEVKTAIQSTLGLQYQKTIEFVDLRWGIHLEKELNESDQLYKVLSICGHMIEQSKPHFLLMLGDSYGTSIDRTLIEGLYQEIHAEADLSVTEVEYLLRTYSLSDIDKIHVLLKSSGNEPDPALKAFRSKIQNDLTPSQIVEYDASLALPDHRDTLAKLLIQTITDMLQRSLQSNKTLKQRPIDDMHLSPIEPYIARMGSNMVGYEDELKSFYNMFFEIGIHMILISGTEGCGKTTFLSHCILDLKQRGIDVFSLFVKQFDCIYPYEAFIDYLIESLECVTDSDPQTPDDLQDKIDYLYNLAKKTDPDRLIVFTVDDYDRFYESGEPFIWMNRDFPSNIRFILSVSDINKATAFHVHNGITIQLSEMRGKDQERFLLRQFAMNHKHVTKDIIHRIHVRLNKSKKEHNPFLMHLMANRLIHLSSKDFESIFQQKNQGIPYSQAVYNIQRDLISYSPTTLEDFAKLALVDCLKEHPQYVYVFGMLIFRERDSLSIDEVSKLFTYMGRECPFPNFLELYSRFSGLLTFVSLTEIRLTSTALIRQITRIIHTQVFDRIVAYFCATIKDEIQWPGETSLFIAVYQKHYEVIAKYWKEEDQEDSDLTLIWLLECQDRFHDDDVLQQIFQVMEMDDHAIRLLTHLLETFFERDQLPFLNRCDELLSVIRSRCLDAMNSTDNQSIEPLLTLYYRVSIKRIRRFENTGKLSIEQVHEEMAFLDQMFSRIDINAIGFFEYFLLMFSIFVNVPESHPLLDRWMAIFYGLSEPDRLALDPASMIGLLWVYQHTSDLPKEQITLYLDMISTILTGSRENPRSELAAQYRIDMLFELARAYETLGFFNQATDCYFQLLDLFQEPEMLYQYTYHNITLLSTIYNQLGVHQQNRLAYLKTHQPELFIDPDESLQALIHSASHHLSMAATLTQDVSNTDNSENSIQNFIVSEVNLAKFLFMYENNPNAAFQSLVVALQLIESNLEKEYHLLDWYVGVCLYITIFQEIAGTSEINTELIVSALRLYLRENPNVDFTYTYDINDMFQHCDMTWTICGMKPTKKYLTLRQQVWELMESLRPKTN